jgi:addiction module HigA family antidote
MIKNTTPIHPGAVLDQIYLQGMKLSQNELARRLRCPPRKVSEIINCKRGISPDFAIGLERVLGTSAAMWVRMQVEHDLHLARKKLAT